MLNPILPRARQQDSSTPGNPPRRIAVGKERFNLPPVAPLYDQLIRLSSAHGLLL
jgi:hypothetical protein